MLRPLLWPHCVPALLSPYTSVRFSLVTTSVTDRHGRRASRIASSGCGQADESGTNVRRISEPSPDSHNLSMGMTPNNILLIRTDPLPIEMNTCSPLSSLIRQKQVFPVLEYATTSLISSPPSV